MKKLSITNTNKKYNALEYRLIWLVVSKLFGTKTVVKVIFYDAFTNILSYCNNSFNYNILHMILYTVNKFQIWCLI